MCLSHEDSRLGPGESRADQSVFGSPRVHISSLQSVTWRHDARAAELLAKQKQTSKMIIRDVLDDDIEVAIKVGFFHSFSIEARKIKL